MGEHLEAELAELKAQVRATLEFVQAVLVEVKVVMSDSQDTQALSD